MASNVAQFARAVCKRASRGLYGGKDVRTGNNVSFSQRKTRRIWKPNVQDMKVYSETLGRFLEFRMTTNVLRTIDKKGGIDNYLITTSDEEIGYDKAITLKKKIIRRQKKQAEAQTGVES